MSKPRFCRFVLRTTDVLAATSFYDAVLGHRGDGIEELPAAARARGAAPHWLGHIGVGAAGGVAAMTARFIACGAERLGPPGRTEPSLLRDPGGAILALTGEDGTSRAPIAWHQLHTRDAPRALAHYVELFGWLADGSFALGGGGENLAFGFEPGGPRAGAIADVAGRPGVHTHWTHFFATPDLDAALERATSLGAVVLGPMSAPDGRRFAVCDDPQGAAFGLMAT